MGGAVRPPLAPSTGRYQQGFTPRLGRRAENYEVYPPRLSEALFRPINNVGQVHQAQYILPSLEISHHASTQIANPFDISDTSSEEYLKYLNLQNSQSVNLEPSVGISGKPASLFTVPIGYSPKDKTPQISLARVQLQAQLWRLVLKSAPSKISEPLVFHRGLNQSWDKIKAEIDLILRPLNEDPQNIKYQTFILAFRENLALLEEKAGFSSQNINKWVSDAKKSAHNINSFSIIKSENIFQNPNRKFGIFSPSPMGDPQRKPGIKEPDLDQTTKGDILPIDSIGDPEDNNHYITPENEGMMSFDAQYYDDVEADLYGNLEQVRKLREERTKAIRDTGTSHRKIDIFDRAINRNHDKKKEHEDQMDQIKDEIVNRIDDNENIDQEIKNLTQNLLYISDSKKRKRIKQKIENLRSKKESNIQEIRTGQQYIDALRERMRKLDRENNFLRSKRTDEENRVHELVDEILDLDKEIKFKEKTLQDLRRELESRPKDYLMTSPPKRKK